MKALALKSEVERSVEVLSLLSVFSCPAAKVAAGAGFACCVNLSKICGLRCGSTVPNMINR